MSKEQSELNDNDAPSDYIPEILQIEQHSEDNLLDGEEEEDTSSSESIEPSSVLIDDVSGLEFDDLNMAMQQSRRNPRTNISSSKSAKNVTASSSSSCCLLI